MPSTAQQQQGEGSNDNSDDYYFGLDSFWGAYSVGFFAGITIEVDHVYIDLNTHTIKMYYEYYLQQRFFAIIELAKKPFESGQGPVNFGNENLKSNDISIKNGNIGLSSHHGIHGVSASNIEISNVNIMNFDVTGIQCKHMLIENVIIGEQSKDIPTLGRYSRTCRLLYYYNENDEDCDRWIEAKN